MQLCTVPEDNRSRPKEVTVYVQKISISLPRKVSILRPPSFHSGNSNKTSYISLDFFLIIGYRTPNPYCGGSMYVFWNCTLEFVQTLYKPKFLQMLHKPKLEFPGGWDFPGRLHE